MRCPTRPSPQSVRAPRGISSVSLVLAGIWWRHEMPPPQGACGRGCAPVPNSVWGRGLSERSEFRSLNRWDRGKGPRRPRPGVPGFGSFCRNKRTASCGGATPHCPPLVVRGRTPANTPPLIGDPGSLPWVWWEVRPEVSRSTRSWQAHGPSCYQDAAGVHEHA